jgi:hypothetical protein
MQVRGAFPELNSGLKKSAKRSKLRAGGMAGFAVKGRGPRVINAPKSLGERRAASHKKAYGD